MIKPCTAADILSCPGLIEEYASESSIQGMPHPAARLSTYQRLERSGAFICFGAYENNILVGFITVLLSVLPHYEVSAATVESVFVSAAHRKSGHGARLIRQAEQHARKCKASGLLICAPAGGKLTKVLARAKSYRQTNHVFFKGFSDAD